MFPETGKNYKKIEKRGGTRRSRKGEVTAEDRKGSRYRPAVCIQYHKKKERGCQDKKGRIGSYRYL